MQPATRLDFCKRFSLHYIYKYIHIHMYIYVYIYIHSWLMVMSRVRSQTWEFEVTKQCGHAPTDSNKTTEARLHGDSLHELASLFEIG